MPITRIRATGRSQPIIWFAGGPGQSNMETFHYDYFLKEHDHVMVGTNPAQNAKEDLLPHLPNGRQVVISEMGHIGGVLLAAVALISIAWLAVRFMRGRENRGT